MTSDCVFCDKSKFEERLVGETKDFWAIATLGQITDGGYLLLVPKRHVECIGAMRIKEIRMLYALWGNILRAFQDEYGKPDALAFEHGVVGQTVKHAHLHLLPVRLDITRRIKNDFPDCKTEYVPLNKLIKIYRLKKSPYILFNEPEYIDFPTGGTRVCWNPPAPPQYLRIVVAEALGHPERANWRAMDPELDKNFAKKQFAA